MAERGRQPLSFEEEEDCSVCRDGLKDPRALDCGHHFCIGCLNEILGKDQHESIKCPNCRAETEVKSGSGVKGLQRPVLITLQEKVAGLLVKAKTEKFTKICDTCTDKIVIAKQHCYECKLNFCEKCFTIHQQMATTHKSVKIVDALFCQKHPNAVVSIHCQSCAEGVCGICALLDHSEHDSSSIDTAAELSSKRIQGFIEAQSDGWKNMIMHQRIKDKLEKAKQLETDLEEKVTEIRRMLKELEEKLNQVERESKAKLAAEIKTLVLYEADIKDLIDSRQSLIDHATYLTTEASKQELVKKEKDFPTTKVCCLQHIDGATIETPIFDENFNNISTKLQQIIDDCKVAFEKNKFGSLKAGDLKKLHTVALSHTVSGMTVDRKQKRLVVRTDDADGPLKCYSYGGQLKETVGAGLTGVTEGSYRGISMDTKRDCYLAPCSSTLVLVDRTGQQITSISVGGQYNCGVAYSQEIDTYVVSDYNNTTVYLIDAATSNVSRQIGYLAQHDYHGNLIRSSLFKRPYNVFFSRVAGLDRLCIGICDYGNSCIKLYDTFGNQVKSYGSPGAGDWAMQNPWGVSTSYEGHIVVCDSGNNRVVSFWTDSAGTNHWECILLNDWDGNQPRHLAVDTDNRIMGVVDSTVKNLHIYF